MAISYVGRMERSPGEEKPSLEPLRARERRPSHSSPLPTFRVNLSVALVATRPVPPPPFRDQRFFGIQSKLSATRMSPCTAHQPPRSTAYRPPLWPLLPVGFSARFCCLGISLQLPQVLVQPRHCTANTASQEVSLGVLSGGASDDDGEREARGARGEGRRGMESRPIME